MVKATAPRSFIPLDTRAVRLAMQEEIKAIHDDAIKHGTLGGVRAKELGQLVFDRDVLSPIPEWLRAGVIAHSPYCFESAIKGCVTIAQEEIARVTLRISGKNGMKDTAGFRAVRMTDSDGSSHYIQVSQLIMTLPETKAVRARAVHQRDALNESIAELDYRIDVMERHPKAINCLQALDAEGVQYEMVFEAV